MNETSNIYTMKNDIEERDNKITKIKIKNKMNNKCWNWKRRMLGFMARIKKSTRKRRMYNSFRKRWKIFIGRLEKGQKIYRVIKERRK